MLPERHLSPQQLSALTALLISVPISIGIYVFAPKWWIAPLCFVVIFAGSYGLVLFTLQTFIYKKIKLIYKLIYQTKATRREEFYYKNILPQKGIDEVRKDVEQWAEQKSKEIELLQANEAYRREFLQNLSHELKTPVFAIQGFVDTLIDGAAAHEETRDKFLQRTAGNVNRLVNLLTDLDEISNLESGRLKMTFSQFRVQDLINEVFDTLVLPAEQKNIQFSIKKECDSSITVYADRERIRQVLSNFIENSVKYGKQDGVVEASFYGTDGNNVLIEISDNGYGIAEEHLPRVFERFYRTDHARSRKEGGSGLGLAICKHIIEAHDRNIHVRSKPDVGTSFGFTLPVSKI